MIQQVFNIDEYRSKPKGKESRSDVLDKILKDNGIFRKSFELLIDQNKNEK